MRVTHVLFTSFLIAFALCKTSKAFEPDVEPLRVPAGKPIPADGSTQLFYYSNGKRIALYSTGFATVSLKNPSQLTKNLPVSETQPTPTDVQRLNTQLAPRNIAIASVAANRTIKFNNNVFGLDSPSPAQADINFTLDIVKGVDLSQPNPSPSKAMALTDRVIVQFSPEATAAQKQMLLSSSGLKELKKLTIPNTVLAVLESGPPTTFGIIHSANEVYENGNLSGGPKLVVYSHPDFVLPIQKQSQIEDPFMAQQWYLDLIRVKDAWQLTQGTPSIRVAVLDDAIETDHPDLAGRTLPGRRYGQPTDSPTTDVRPRSQDERHGTPCAGIIAAAANSIGVRGIAPGIMIIPVSMMDGSSSTVAEAFYFATDPDGDASTDDGARVISASWTWRGPVDDIIFAVADVSKNAAGGKGAVVVFAAGNDGESLSAANAIASTKDAILVGSVDYNSDHAAYSNFGPELSVVAPSVASVYSVDHFVVTTDRVGDQGYNVGDYTGLTSGGFGGTSASAPMVAATAALVLSKNPQLTSSKVRDILQSTARKIPGVSVPALYDAVGHSDIYGFGLIDAASAVAAATNPAP
jgi:hypothetical protein